MKLHRGMVRLLVLSLGAAAAVPVCVRAQEQAAAPKPAPAPAPAAPVAPAANAADVASPDAILAALYDVISGPAGKRDWTRFRSLFLADARLIPAGPLKPGITSPRVLSPEGYAALVTPFFDANGFFEKEVARRTERFGSVLHAFSTYESRHKADDAAPFARGINSIQLFFDGTRWWIVTVLWQQETPEVRLPKEFLAPVTEGLLAPVPAEPVHLR
jgi:hypothetical protein